MNKVEWLEVLRRKVAKLEAEIEIDRRVARRSRLIFEEMKAEEEKKKKIKELEERGVEQC